MNQDHHYYTSANTSTNTSANTSTNTSANVATNTTANACTNLTANAGTANAGSNTSATIATPNSSSHLSTVTTIRYWEKKEKQHYSDYWSPLRVHARNHSHDSNLGRDRKQWRDRSLGGCQGNGIYRVRVTAVLAP